MALPRYIEPLPPEDAYRPRGGLPSVGSGRVLVDEYHGGGAAMPPVTGEAIDQRTTQRANAEAEIANAQTASQRRVAEARATKAAAEERRRRIAEEKARQAKARLTNPTAAGEGTIEEGVQQFGTAVQALQGHAVTVPRATYGVDKQFTDTMIGHGDEYARDKRGRVLKDASGNPIVARPATTGLVQEQAPAAAAVHAAEISREVAHANALQQTADDQLKAMQMLRANQQAQAEREQAQQERIRMATDLAAKAADKFESVKDVDPGRYWRSQPAFMKFIAAIAAGLKGWAGRTDATSHITDAIASDIEAQKAEIAKASANVGNRQAQAAREESVYGQILAQTGSEREADLIYTKALMEHAAARTAAVLQKATVPHVIEQARYQMNSLLQQIAGLEQQIGRVAVANTPTRTVVSRPSGPVAALYTELGKQGIRDISEGRKAIGAAAAAGQAQEAAAAIERAKAGQPTEGDKRINWSQKEYVTTQTAPLREELRQAEAFKEKYANGVPGFVFGIGWARPKPGEINPFWGEAEEEAYGRMKRIIMIRLRRESGAAIGQREEGKDSPYGSSGEGAMSWGEAGRQAEEIMDTMGPHQSEGALMNEIDRRIEEARERIKHFERAPDESAIGELNRAAPVPFDPRTSGGTSNAAQYETWE